MPTPTTDVHNGSALDPLLAIFLITDSLPPFLEAQASDVTWHVHVTRVNMNVNIPHNPVT